MSNHAHISLQHMDCWQIFNIFELDTKNLIGKKNKISSFLQNNVTKIKFYFVYLIYFFTLL